MKKNDLSFGEGSSFPKVLILGTPINQNSGGSITVSNLFRGWPAEKLAVVHSSLHGNDPSRAIEFALRMEMVLPCMQSGAKWNTREEIMSDRNGTFVSRKANPTKFTLHRDVFRRSVEFLGIAALIRRFPMTRDLIRFVSDFEPDVIYTHLGDMPMATLLIDLIGQFHTPYIIHVMDDYPSTLYRQGLFAGSVRRRMHDQLAQLFSQASACMGISQAMCEEYSVRYGRNFMPFHNTVDPSVWGSDDIKDAQDKKSFKLIYAGRIGVSCLTSIGELCAVIDGWRDPDISITFDIYVNNMGQALSSAPFLKKSYSNINVKETPKRTSDIASLLGTADILVLPVDFDRDAVEYIRYSMPTKVPAYMATGVPILLYGPPDVASVKYAKAEKWAHVIGERSLEALKQGIRRLCIDKDLRAILSQRSRQLVALKHDASKVRNRFREAIVCAVRGRDETSRS